MSHKKQKKKGYGKHYPNRLMQYGRKKKKHGKKSFRTPMPYYFATNKPSYTVPIRASLPPQAIAPPLYPTPTLSPAFSTPSSLQLPSSLPFTTASTAIASALPSDYINTSTVVSEYTYTSTAVSGYIYTSTPTPLSFPIATPEIVNNNAVDVLSDEDTIPEDTSQINDDINNKENSEFDQIVIAVDESENDVPTVSAAAAIARGSNSSQAGTLASPNQTMQIAGPILGIVGAMAIVAAAMFLVVRRKRRRQNVSHIKEENEGHYFEMPSPPPPIPLHEEKTKDDENRFSHGTGTLVGSSRTNSTIKKHMSISSWYSASSSLLEVPSQPEVMLAERQQLQHERPSLLDHWKKPAFIETYRAQLADLSDITDTI